MKVQVSTGTSLFNICSVSAQLSTAWGLNTFLEKPIFTEDELPVTDKNQERQQRGKSYCTRLIKLDKNDLSSVMDSIQPVLESVEKEVLQRPEQSPQETRNSFQVKL